MVNSVEEWIKLGCDIIPEGRYIVTKLIQNTEGTKIFLDDEKIAVEIFFDGIPLLVRQAREGVRMRTWAEIQRKYNDKSFYRNHFFFDVKNSSLVEWTVEEGCGFYEKDNITHYSIVTNEEIIDILSEFEPILTVANI